MEVPRHWRLQKTRYGNGEGELKLAVCPVCGEKIFPPNRPFCTHCNSSMKENIAFRSEAVGVGALTFVETNEGLKLLLFDDVDSNLSDDEGRKRERVIFPADHHDNQSWLNIDQTTLGQDYFTRPRGVNTVTGKVENGESQLVLDFLQDSDNYDSLSFEQLPPAFVNALYTSMLREMEEEVPGLSASDLEDKVHFFSKSSFKIEQVRPIDADSDRRALYDFVVFVLAILIEEGDLSKIEREGWRLYSPQELAKIDQKEFRKATLAVLDFLPAALLFLADEGKIPQEEMLSILAERDASI
ncbi:MAG TPA: hypothetical protein PL154_01030 [Candidatus Woesebacteria bacterium]|nr:hypothetical protein [Candidatus Woesebacteria bacterium]HOP38831.1 hypothetical protein [Candidatus Woesebacteria bacterium]HPK08535.1 hypothetical protein [Candidatus Woesebacteria bacterium]HPR14050.1 hypothetical protein [Candidatus Woesebacteria bacterium]HQL11232.1 hypothetical protein [Candidatus Woesebacteria bacterium]